MTAPPPESLRPGPPSPEPPRPEGSGESYGEHTLRRVLETEARRVDVTPYALDRIRYRIATGSNRGGRVMAIGTGSMAGVVATVTAAVLGLGTCSAPGTDPPPVGTSPGPARAAVPVFYLGSTEVGHTLGGEPRSGLRLYREVRELPVGDGSAEARVRAALEHLFTSRTAYDPDYHTGWGDLARVRNVRVRGGVATVELTGDRSRFYSPELSVMAARQLVWTVTGTPGVTAVRLQFAGVGESGTDEPIAGGPAWKQVEAALGDPPWRRASEVDVLAPVHVTAPRQWQSVPTSFEVRLEAVVLDPRLRVRRGDDVVHDEPVIARHNPGGDWLRTATVPLTLPPGDYVLEAYQRTDGVETVHDDVAVSVRDPDAPG